MIDTIRQLYINCLIVYMDIEQKFKSINEFFKKD